MAKGTTVSDDEVSAVAARDIAAARLIVGRKLPYFAPFILDLRDVEKPGLGTMGSTPRGLVYYDPKVVAREWTASETCGVYLHEMLHVWLGHGLRRGSRDPKEWNWAGDRAINQIVMDAGFPLPGKPLSHTDLNMEPYLAADDYYQPPDDDDNGGGPPPPGAHPGSGSCGGCAGNPGPDEPGEKEEEDAGCRAPDVLEQHAAEAAEAINADTSGKQAGNIPLGLQRAAAIMAKPAKVDWRGQLRRNVRRAIHSRPGANFNNWNRLSRLQWGVGFGEGKPLLHSHKDLVPKVWLVLDTSASMGGAELDAAITETNGVLKALGSPATFLSCDTQVHAIGEVKRAKDVLKLVKGGGGTDFRPVFAAALAARERPELLVFFTDGFGPAPESPPAGIATLWVLTGAQVHEPCAWGEKVRVDLD